MRLVGHSAIIFPALGSAVGLLTFGAAAKEALVPYQIRYETVSSHLFTAPFGPVRVTELAVLNAAHAESGALSISYLKRRAGKLVSEAEFPKVVKSGSFGRVGSWHLDTRFGRLPVIVTQGDGTWQGQTCSWTTITELRPQRPTQLVTFQQSEVDQAMGPRGAFEAIGKIVSINRSRNFIVHFSGTRTFDATYERKGNRYVLKEGKDHALIGC